MDIGMEEGAISMGRGAASISFVEWFNPNMNLQDSWRWYMTLQVHTRHTQLTDNLLKTASKQEKKRQLWRKYGTIPSKMQAFVWRMILNRLPTKSNLSRRYILADDSNHQCVLCEELDENNEHLLVYCAFSFQVWMKCFAWIGVQTALFANVKKQFEIHLGLRKKKIKKCFGWCHGISRHGPFGKQETQKHSMTNVNRLMK